MSTKIHHGNRAKRSNTLTKGLRLNTHRHPLNSGFPHEEPNPYLPHHEAAPLAMARAIEQVYHDYPQWHGIDNPVINNRRIEAELKQAEILLVELTGNFKITIETQYQKPGNTGWFVMTPWGEEPSDPPVTNESSVEEVVEYLANADEWNDE
jgi:hypothetical protein